MSHSGRRHKGSSARTISSAMDRRLACRYPAAIKAMVLSSIASGSQVDYAAQLENVSMQGCLVTTRRSPPMQPGERVWLKALGDVSSPVIHGIVVSAVKPFLGKRSIRIRFHAPLPYQTFKMLVYGTEGTDMSIGNRPVYERDDFWK